MEPEQLDYTPVDPVTYELVPPYSRFECMLYNGTMLEILGPYTTDNPRVISELDAQTHALRRVDAKPAKK